MRQLIITLALLTATMLHAKERWCIADSANPDVPLAEMAQVAYLLTNDYDSQLCLVCRDGTVYPGLKGFTFRQFDTAAIQPAQRGTEPQMAIGNAGQTLTVNGCRNGSQIAVYSLAGSRLVTMTANGGHAQINIAHLTAGIYLLQVDNTTVKFQKR